MLAKFTIQFKQLVAAPLLEIALHPQKNPASPMLGIFMAAFKIQSFNCYFSQDCEKVGQQQYTPEAGKKARERKVPWPKPLREPVAEAGSSLQHQHQFQLQQQAEELGNTVKAASEGSVLNQKCHRALPSINSLCHF